MVMIKLANLALRFILELCALAGLGYWGFQTGKGLIAKIGLGIGAPLLAALIWGAFVAPNASVTIPGSLRLVLELVIFGSAIAALYASKHPTLAVIFGLVVVINRILMYVWEQ
jgi:quinol-cytochrome oxidoreductase complex cytochrome b subunit